MSKPYRFGTAPQGGFDLSNRTSNRLARMRDLEEEINKTMNGPTPMWTYSTRIKGDSSNSNVDLGFTQEPDHNSTSLSTTSQSQSIVHYQGSESPNRPVDGDNVDSSNKIDDNVAYTNRRDPMEDDLNAPGGRHGSDLWSDWTILHEMIDGFRSADVSSWVGESGPAVKVTDRTEWVDVDLNPTSIDPIITPDMSNSHSASDDDKGRSGGVSRNGSTRSPKRNDEPLELESPRNRSDDLSITLVFMLVSVMVMASSIVGMGVSMISGFNILDLLTYGFTGVASTMLFGTSLGDLGKIYNVRRSPGEKFLDWVRRLGKTMGMESEGPRGSSGPSTRARHRHKVKMVSGVMGDPYVLEDDDSEEHDDGVIEIEQLEDKTAHGVTEIIDSWTNALSRVGLDSRTGDMMDRVADYWYMAVDAIDSMDDLKVMVAEVVEPVSALGDVVSMCVKMRKSSRLYSEKELDDAKVMLVDAENSMIEVFRKAARRSLDATRSKAESSLGYLKSKRDGDLVIQEVNESIGGGASSKTGEIVGTSKDEDGASGTSTYDVIGEPTSRASSEVESKESGEGAGVIASPGL